MMDGMEERKKSKKGRLRRRRKKLETENVASRSLGRRKATSIHNHTNKITTPTVTTTAESSHSSFPSLDRLLRVANRLQVDFANVVDGGSPLFLSERRVQKVKEEKEALFCFRRSNLHNNSITN